MADVEKKLGFPMFQKYSEMFGVDLSKKTSKVERDMLRLSLDEVLKVKQETECETIEEYIVELGENANEFQMLMMDLLGAKAKDMVIALRELWLETHVLHKTAVFLRQCFADPVSRAVLTDAKDKNAKFARNILMTDIMEAQAIRKSTNNRVNSIEQLVMLYCERETYNIQNFPEQVDDIDDQMEQGLGTGDRVDQVWEIVTDVILERLTRKPHKKRPSISEPKLLEWVECMDPELELTDLPDYSKERIDEYK